MSDLNRIYSTLTQKKATGTKVSPWEYQAAREGELAAMNASRSANRALDIQQDALNKQLALGQGDLDLQQRAIDEQIRQNELNRKAAEEAGQYQMISTIAQPLLLSEAMGGEKGGLLSRGYNAVTGDKGSLTSKAWTGAKDLANTGYEKTYEAILGKPTEAAAQRAEEAAFDAAMKPAYTTGDNYSYELAKSGWTEEGLDAALSGSSPYAEGALELSSTLAPELFTEGASYAPSVAAQLPSFEAGSLASAYQGTSPFVTAADPTFISEASSLAPVTTAGAETAAAVGSDAAAAALAAEGAGFGTTATGATTLGSVAGAAGTAVSSALPWIALWKVGMPILKDIMAKGTSEAFGIDPDAGKGGVPSDPGEFWAMQNRIAGDARGVITPLLEDMGVEVPEIFTALTNPAGYIIDQVFCFYPGTKVTMADGTEKSIEDIKIGEEVKDGGMITGRGEVLGGEIYDYHGVKVAGSHAVKERGTWKRVSDSDDAVYYEDGPRILYLLDTVNHRLLIEGITFSDFTEVTGSQYLMPEERIDHLNLEEGCTSTSSYDSRSEARL